MLPRFGQQHRFDGKFADAFRKCLGCKGSQTDTSCGGGALSVGIYDLFLPGTVLIMPGSRVRVPPFPPVCQQRMEIR